VSDDPLAAWHELCKGFAKLSPNITRTKTVHINSLPVRDEVKAISRQYIKHARPLLIQHGFDEATKFFDENFAKLYELADARSLTFSYRLPVALLGKGLTRVTPQLEMKVAGGNSGVRHTSGEIRIAETLAGLVPTAGLSYRQALSDLADPDRESFRGPATELREALREVLDHLAPDEDVLKSDGFRLEPERTKPTMKQKVRFILRARDESATDTPEKAVETIEGLVGGFTRSIYNFGSQVTHVAGERRAVINLKRYVEVVLSHLLEL
jgi:hypothetical protein